MIIRSEWGSDLHSETEETSQLTLGINYEQEGEINDALVTYLGVIARYPGSEERQVAEERLLRLTRAFLEETGKIHPAMLVYEHLKGVF